MTGKENSKSSLINCQAALEGLPALIADAAGRLAKAGDVAQLLDAKQTAAVIYDAAKSAARLATTKKNVDQLTRAAHRAQADALEIESVAWARLADEYDLAQKAGDVAGKGRQANVPGKDICLPPTLSDIGVTRQDMHRARQIRDAEQSDPGIVSRALKARFESGENPNRAFLRKLVSKSGSRAAVSNERNANAADPQDENLYQTPWVAVDLLLNHLPVSDWIWEPAMGPGAIVQRLADHGHQIVGSDLIDYSLDKETGEVNPVWASLQPPSPPPVVGDFLALAKHPFGRYKIGAIIANPPFNKADAFIAKAHELARRHKIPVVAMLVRVGFMAGHGEARCRSLDGWKPSRQIVCARRLPMMHREGFAGKKSTTRLDTCWLIWELDRQGGEGRTTVERVDWARDLDLDENQIKAVINGAGPDVLAGEGVI